MAKTTKTNTKTIKVNFRNETLTISKFATKTWGWLGRTNRVVWKDQNGGMWVRMSGEWIEVQYYVSWRDEREHDSAVERVFGGRTAKEIAA